MKADEAAKLIAGFQGIVRGMVDDPSARGSLVPAPTNGAAKGAVGDPVALIATSRGFDKESLYQEFKARIIDECRVDPMLLHLLTTQNEIIVDVEVREVRIDGSSLKGRIARLIASGWLKEPSSTGNIKRELMRTGTEPNGSNLSNALGDFVKDGLMVRAGDGYAAAPGIKVTENLIATA